MSNELKAFIERCGWTVEQIQPLINRGLTEAEIMQAIRADSDPRVIVKSDERSI